MTTKKGKKDDTSTKRAMADVTILEIANLEEQMQLNPSVQVFERSLRRIPSAAMYWMRYIDFMSELPEKSQKLAERAVLVCPHIDLWRRYLQLTKEVCMLTELVSVYGKIIHGIGQYYKTGDIWLEYLYILKVIYNQQLLRANNTVTSELLPPGNCTLPLPKSVPSGIPATLIDEYSLEGVSMQPDLSFIRQVYHSALSSPIDRLDLIWDEYQSFEQTVGAAITTQTATSAKFLTLYSARYLKSKQVYKELGKLHASVNLYVIPLPLNKETALRMRPQIIAWRQVIKYEQANHAGLSTDILRRRVTLVFNQCLMGNCYIAEFWYEQFLWLFTQGLKDEAVAALHRAIEDYLPSDVFLRLVLTTALEEEGHVADAEKAYKDLLDFFAERGGCSLGFVHYFRFIARNHGETVCRKFFLDHFISRSTHCQWLAIKAFSRFERYAFSNPTASEKLLRVALARLRPDDDGYQQLGGALVDLVTDLRGDSDELRKELGITSTDYDGVIRLTPMPPLSEIKSLVQFQQLLTFRHLVPPLSDTKKSAVNLDDDMAVEAIDLEGDVLFIDGAEEQAVGIRRPILSKLQLFKPQVDQDATTDVLSSDALEDVPVSLRALLTLLPPKDAVMAAVPIADAVVKILRNMELPSIAVDKFKEMADDPLLARLRQKDGRTREGAVDAQRKTLNLKRLLLTKDEEKVAPEAAGEEDEEDAEVRVKRDATDDADPEGKEFLSAMITNIHRERVQYKRHRLMVSAFEEAAVMNPSTALGMPI